MNSPNRSVLSVCLLLFAQYLYSAPEEGRGTPTKIERGEVLEAFPYITDGHHTGRGMAIGAALGGASRIDAIIGPYVISSDPTAMVLGSIAGGALGMLVEKSINSERLVRIYVLLKNGEEIVVTQPQGKRKFRANDKVKILHYGRKEKIVYHEAEYVEWETNPYIVDLQNRSDYTP